MNNIANLFNTFPSEEELLNIIKYTSTTSLGSEFSEKDINAWLGNFKGEVIDVKYEKLLALWLLSHFTYYNKEEVNHLCKVLYSDLIYLIVRKIDTTPRTIDYTVNSFFSKSNIISAEETSGSGGFIAYIFRQVNELPIKELFNFSLENISDDIQNIIVIDDVTLSVGEACQKYKFWKKARELYPSKNFYLLTLIANRESSNDLQNAFNITVVSPIKLDNRDRCFSSESDVFSSFPQLIDVAKNMSKHYGKK
ncbi:MAG: hypothetical protein LBE13_18650, partial [Bacteroidales bacterium]|nr:hypothetical protein [Bacteroidales bacterium]